MESINGDKTSDKTCCTHYPHGVVHAVDFLGLRNSFLVLVSHTGTSDFKIP